MEENSNLTEYTRDGVTYYRNNQTGGYGLTPSSASQPLVSSQESIAYDSSKSLEDNLISLMNSKLSSETKDYLVQYWMNESLSANAFNREYEASKKQHQNAVEDLKKAGISPFLAFDGLRGSSASSSAGSVSGGLSTQRKNQATSNAADVSGRVLTVIAIIAAAVIGAML